MNMKARILMIALAITMAGGEFLNVEAQASRRYSRSAVSRGSKTAGLEAPDFSQVNSYRARGKLKGVLRGYRRAQKTLDRATFEKSPTKAARRYKDAGRLFERTLRASLRLHREYPREEVLRKALTGWIPRLVDSATTAYLELASRYTSRGSYKRALDAVDRISRLGGSQRRLRQLRRHIQLAQAAAGRR